MMNVHVQNCSICKQPGHNACTCPKILYVFTLQYIYIYIYISPISVHVLFLFLIKHMQDYNLIALEHNLIMRSHCEELPYPRTNLNTI